MMSCSLKVRRRQDGEDILESVRCDFCSGEIPTRHICRFEKTDGKYCIEPRQDESKVPICGLAFCAACNENFEGEESAKYCFNHRDLNLNMNRGVLKPLSENIMTVPQKLSRKNSKISFSPKSKKSMKKPSKATKALTSIARKTKSTRMAYKNRKVLAPFSMFVEEKYFTNYSQILEVKNTMMVGTIKDIGKKTGKQYFIDWDLDKKPPALNTHHLQRYFPFSEHWRRTVLKRARENYEASVLIKNIKPKGNEIESLAENIESAVSNELDTSLLNTSKKDPKIMNVASSDESEGGIYLDNVTTGQPVLIENLFLPGGIGKGNIDGGDDISKDSDEGNYNLQFDSAYEGDYNREDQDDGEDQVSNEMDRNMKWRFKDFNGENDTNLKLSGDIAVKPYAGTERLKSRARQKSMDSVKECVEKFGGMDENYFLRLTTNSNAYAQTRITNGKFGGSEWVLISIGEMMRFHGILLRMSIDGRKIGGYETYFSESKSYIQVLPNYVTKLDYLTPWASDIMTFKRFKQIRAAYHHESSKHDHDDKCWQIRYVINKLNDTASQTFIPTKDLAFDEGGIACRSRYCLITIYNPSKPDPHRIEFYVLSSSTFPYEVLYLDIHQGKNEAFIGIIPEHRGFPTTQRCVLDAVLKTCIGNDPLGFRRIWLDNRYACPQLLVNLLHRYRIRAAGTCRSNRIGWQKDQLNMKNKSPRGSMKQMYDERNQLLEIQWKDSKVLGFVSTIQISGTTTVMRRSGPNILHVTCPPAIAKYNKYMGGVDRGDAYRKKSGGFAQKSHFKKWHKKAALTVNDFMLLNAWAAWCLIRKLNDSFFGKMCELTHAEFIAVYAEELCKYFDETERPNKTLHNLLMREHKLASSGLETNYNHTYQPIQSPSCVICRIELNFIKIKDNRGTGPKSQLNLRQCSTCGLIAHICPPSCNRKIFDMFEKGLSCFDIAHNQRCEGLYSLRRKNGKQCWEVRKSHSTYKLLMKAHGVEHLPRRYKKNSSDAETSAL